VIVIGIFIAIGSEEGVGVVVDTLTGDTVEAYDVVAAKTDPARSPAVVPCRR
jgi:hypothetical protein